VTASEDAEPDRPDVILASPQHHSFTVKVLRRPVEFAKDALISFAASHYSVPWRKVRAGSRVELRVTPTEVAIFTLGGQPRLLATHPRALGRGGWVVDQTHWDGLPDRAEGQPLPPCADDCALTAPPDPDPGQLQLPGLGGWASSPAARVLVAQRRLAVYDQLVGVAS
jgi:hypothetical protein